MNMRSYNPIFHFNPKNPEDVVLLGVLDELVKQHGGKVHALRWMLRQATHPTQSTVTLDDESVRRLVDEIERRGMQTSIPRQESAESGGTIVISPSLLARWK